MGHPTYPRYYTRAIARKMAGENDAIVERLEKAHQDTQEKVAEMMEMIRTLMKGKESTECETAQPDRRREEPTYPPGFTPSYVPTVQATQIPIPQVGSFPYVYAPYPAQLNEMGQNLGANAAEPIAIPDLDDPSEQEKIKKESVEQSEQSEAQ